MKEKNMISAILSYLQWDGSQGVAPLSPLVTLTITLLLLPETFDGVATWVLKYACWRVRKKWSNPRRHYQVRKRQLGQQTWKQKARLLFWTVWTEEFLSEIVHSENSTTLISRVHSTTKMGAGEVRRQLEQTTPLRLLTWWCVLRKTFTLHTLSISGSRKSQIIDAFQHSGKELIAHSSPTLLSRNNERSVQLTKIARTSKKNGPECNPKLNSLF